MSWNVRGVASCAFRRTLKEFLRQYNLDIVILLETKVSGNNARRIIQGAGFNYFIIEEAQSFIRGIWICWKDNSISITTLESNQQFIHTRVQRHNQDPWCLTAKIVKIWPTFQKHTVKFVGDGTTTRFWTERWVNNKGSLLNIATMNITNIESTVSEWINRDGNWNRNILKNYLPEEKTMKILALPPTPPNKENGTDRIGWMHSDNGDFSVASTYKALANWTKPTTTIWSKIWKWQGPQKAKIFIWKAKHNRIPTNHKKARMFASRGDCHLCQNHQEDLLHALRDCPKVSRTWVQLIRPSALQIFFQANREEWMDMNIQQQLEHDQNQNWMDIFIIACWKM
ncbi:hypothetical protein Ahy_B01g056442 [Arachis hypogaea]|uniref:Uncharacterized protein n=1 Tax=Arachis hypogaea TaxID=3818 RepID=A0A445AYY8_ARAHY|nr:hypothetical protein Ahy_B01g056442 [Arachis hypogaea]